MALSAAYLVAATMVVFVVAQAAPVVTAVVPRYGGLLVLAAASVVGISIDLRAMSKRGWSVGLSRQTPKRLMFLGEHAWITPFVWGFDTGLIWTTYHVSFCSWLLLMLAFAGIAPAWAGVIYGLAFAIPFVLATHFRYSSDRSRQLTSAIPVQFAGMVSMVLLTASLSVSLLGDV